MVTPAFEVWCCPPYEVRFRLTPHAAPSFTNRTDVRMSVAPPTVARIEHEFARRRKNGDDDAMGNGPAGARPGRGEHGGAHQAARNAEHPHNAEHPRTTERPRDIEHGPPARSGRHAGPGSRRRSGAGA